MSEKSELQHEDHFLARVLNDRFREPLTSFFQRRLRSRTDAEDLTQEVFIRLMRHPDRNDGKTIDAYVFKIAASVLNDWLRRLAARHAHSLCQIRQQEDVTAIPACLVEGRDPERVVIGKQSLKNIEDALGELGSRTRDIFLLSRLENVPHREIARDFGISVSAVEKHVIKAVAYLSSRAFRS